MDQDCYARLGRELRALFKSLEHPGDRAKILRQLDHVAHLAEEAGDPLQTEAARLKTDVLRWLDAPGDEKLAEIVKEHALRLEQETREI